MEAHQPDHLFLILFLFLSLLFVSVFKKFKISSVLAYLSVGVILGPSGVNVNAGGLGSLLGEVGVLFLMFTIGLELPWERLKVLRTYVLGIGNAQFWVTGVIFSAIAYLASTPMRSAVVLGGGLALSSTAVVLQELSDRREFASRHGRVAFAILLLQDFAAIALLMLANFHTQSSAPLAWILTQSALKVGGVLCVILILARFVLSPLYKTIAQLKSPELMMITTLLVVLGTSLLTRAGGLSQELGAFVAGLILAGTEYRHQVEVDIHPFQGLFLGLFFVSMGLSLDVSLLAQDPKGVLSFLCGVLLIKGGLITMLSLLFGFSVRTGLRLAFLLASGSEFVFVLVSPNLNLGIMDPVVHPYIMLCVALSMALTPLLNMVGISLAKHWGADEELEHAASESLKKHVVVIGFGELGQMVVKLLKKHDISCVVLDNHAQRVSAGRAQGVPIFLGDAKRMDIVEAIGASQARAIVLAIKKDSFVTKVALSLKKHFPAAEVIVGLSEEKNIEKLKKAQVRVVYHDRMEHHLTIGHHILSAVDIPQDQVRETLEHARRTRGQMSDEIVADVGGS